MIYMLPGSNLEYLLTCTTRCTLFFDYIFSTFGEFDVRNSK